MHFYILLSQMQSLTCHKVSGHKQNVEYELYLYLRFKYVLHRRQKNVKFPCMVFVIYNKNIMKYHEVDILK